MVGGATTATTTATPTPTADIHSPLKGFWWSHVGWILCDKSNETDLDRIKDFAKYPELRFLNKHDWIAPWTLGVVCFLIAGWRGLLIGFFLSTVLLWHATFIINSLAHVFGRRRYETDDTSRNTRRSRCSRWARAGTTTTTAMPTCAVRARSGGRST